MSNFDEAIKDVLNFEGGFINDPLDPGGATNYGISLRWLKSIPIEDADINDDGVVDENDIEDMQESDAIRLYKKYWWDEYNFDNIKNLSIATKLFNFTINMGNFYAVKCLQRAIRSINCNRLAIDDDGVLGNQTLSAINSINDNSGILSFLAAFRSEAAGYYRSLNNPHAIKGWLNRAYS